MANNSLKAKVDEFIQRGIDIWKEEYHPAGGGFSCSCVSGPKYDAWMGEIKIFNERYLKAHPLHDSIATAYHYHKERPASYRHMMGFLRALSADEEFFETTPIQPPTIAGGDIMGNKVFIVHGHDDAAKFEVAHMLETLGFEPIILHERPDQGRTIIEKFEDHADVGFAVILYTGCDLGREKEASVDSERHRARQNVVFEHGFFVAKLGRDHVCALVKGEVETPGDLSGIIYVPMDEKGAWKLGLAKNMKAAVLPVDMNSLV